MRVYIDRVKKILFLFFIAFLLFPQKVFAADVVINEFSSNSDPEWVELYNSSSTEIVDLEGWRLVDSNTQTTDDIDLSGCITPGGFRLFSRGSGWLNNTGGDTITLKNNNGNEVNSVVYGASGVIGIPSPSNSASRVPNGSSTWEMLDPPSSTDSICQLSSTPTPTLIPTLSPTNSPTPTKTPTPTPTIKPTATSKPVATATPAPTSIPTIKVVTPTMAKMATYDNYDKKENMGPTSILGEMVTATPSAMPTEVDQKKAEESFFNFPKLAIGVGFIFLAVSGILAFRKWNDIQNEYAE